MCLLWYCWCVWAQVAPCLCSGHVLRRCSAMLGAIGCSLEVCIVFWPTGLVDNLHPIAIECDSAEVSTGLWIRSVGCWFITWHTLTVRWCISKKLQKNNWNSYEMQEFGFRAGMLGYATSSSESFVFRSYWFIFWRILEWGQYWVSLAVSSLLHLLDSFVDQENFQGTRELRFFMEYLAHHSSGL